MELQLYEIDDRLIRIMHKLELGGRYFKNAVYFQQFLNLRIGNLTVDEYASQFSMLQCLCKLKESETHELDRFIRGL